MAKAQKGDLIRLTNVACGAPIKNGEIYEVLWADKAGDARFVGPDGTTDWYASPHQYEIHRKAGEEDSELIDYKDAIVLFAPGEVVIPKKDAEKLLKQDAVDSPNHYTQGRFETIEIIEEITQGYSDGYVAYCVGNALKYLARAPFKHGEPVEDIGKAAKYIEFALARLQT